MIVCFADIYQQQTKHFNHLAQHFEIRNQIVKFHVYA
jgi:hypothetical protein